MPDQDGNSEKLIQDLHDWLPSAAKSDILQYVKNLRDEGWYSLITIKADLISTLRSVRNHEIEMVLQTNLVQLLSESELLEFLNNLTKYSPISVVNSYQKYYSSLRISIPNLALNNWAIRQLESWKNLFYLFSARKYIDYSFFLKSLLEFDLSVLDSMYAECREINLSLCEDMASHNYEPHDLPATLQNQVNSFLTGLKFLPEDYVNDFGKAKSNYELLGFIEIFTYLLQYLHNFIQAGSDLSDHDFVIQVLWDDLALESEAEEIWNFTKLQEEAKNRQTLDGKYDRYRQIENLFSVSRIENGECLRLLQQYLSGLTPDKRNVFMQELEGFLHSSVLIKEIISPVEIDFFLESIKKENLTLSKNDFINNLKPKFVDERWPLAQKTMLVLAVLF